MDEEKEIVFEADFDVEDEEEINITFAPGCFDDFQGTQEELDELVATLKAQAASGEMYENAIYVESEEEYNELVGIDPNRKLH